MTFYVHGLSGHEVMPLVRLFDQRAVEKTHAIAPGHRVDTMEHHNDDVQKKQHSGVAVQSYQEIDQLPQSSPVLLANQIMTSPVVTLKSQDSIADAMGLFKTRQLRHIPVVTDNGVVEGILSDRDILRHMSGVTEGYEQHMPSARTNDRVGQLMKTQVLTASADTDVRYIARLFVEQRVGAMPIVIDGNLVGMITRSDVLGAVMRHFILELWV